MNTIEVPYICGESNCGKINHFKGKDQLRCRECGHRVFYKLRNEEGMIYEAK